ncbi:MAG TPA: LLM class F420-dependent oxidoreductase [Acidimicrobiales bacterium]
MKFGVFLPQREIGHNPEDLFRFVRAVEDEGFDFLQATDHVLGADPAAHPGQDFAYDVHDLLHEQFVLFAYLAGTTNLEFVNGVLILTQRQTALVAKQAAEVDILSGGRLRLGVGTGWNTVEYEALGVPFDDRGDRFEEQIHVLRKFWTEEAVTFEGAFHQIHGAGILPRPARSVPIWIGGGAGPNQRVLRRIGRLADGWLASAPATEELAVKLKVVHEAAREAGRDEPPGLNLGTRVNHRDADMLRRELDAAQALGAGYFTIRADQPTDPEDKRHPRSVEWYLDMLHFAGGVIPEYRD